MNGELLKRVTESFVPSLLVDFDWGDIWERPIESGTAFEWSVFASLIFTLEINGWEYEFPLKNVPGGSNLFLNRNEIPLQHGAQAGHSSNTLQETSLSNKFIQSLIPKAVIRRGDKTYSIFREGLPYHRIMTRNDYFDRPDIIIIPGAPSKDYPMYDIDRNEVSFSFDFSEEKSLSGLLRVVNSPIIPCKRRTPKSGMLVPVHGVIECSVNKTAKIAKAQLEKYSEIFGIESRHNALITGNKITEEFPYLKSDVDINSQDLEVIQKGLIEAAAKVLSQFGLI
ncbi:hypothetical protein [Priestia megaterium]|uniref:hypothetical protein n=1 Tax=Priestia megaterium TaxID=1404 RepID=UPI003A8448F8